MRSRASSPAPRALKRSDRLQHADSLALLGASSPAPRALKPVIHDVAISSIRPLASLIARTEGFETSGVDVCRGRSSLRSRASSPAPRALKLTRGQPPIAASILLASLIARTEGFETCPVQY